MKKYIYAIGMLALSVAMLSGCKKTAEEPVEEPVVTTAVIEEKKGDPSFSNFEAVNLDGEVVNQDIFADYDLTMINIWGTFCGPCIREMPDLGEIHAEYKDKNFQVVGIVTDVQNNDGSLSEEQLTTAREIVEKTGANYMHLLPSYDLTMAKLKDVAAIPETIFVDKDGNLVGEAYMGAKNKEDWLKIIDGLLED